ncbi:hypothetical protein AB0H83_51305 [Dactylosporangium sp. NPDC050688]|uniref:HD domain-containing protein n=1 Tax=Dactylosporangium sp. NPDC050688 TaxID=3157217 RepID=UPI0033DE7FDB
MSSLLFDDSGNAVLQLSSVEAYLLCIAAYLHDAGMVVTEAEKLKLLASTDWVRFIKDSKLDGAWQEILEGAASASNDEIARYSANLQTRYLIAEYFRQQHADRSAEVVLTQEASLAGFAFEEPAVKRTLADICLGHGLPRDQLDDDGKFPFRRDLLNERVNVRLLAILLRLGDLLDLRYSRACPLLQLTSTPMPSHSAPHWQQYSAIQHLLVAPDRIEVRASCETHEAHRVLHDWLTWLANETVGSQRLLAGSTRHADWSAPLATLSGPNPTMQVDPAPTARYSPVAWRFELDAEAVFERLIKDAYTDVLSFVGELLQNSLDATRVRLSEDLRRTPEGVPRYPNLAPLSVRQKYPIEISIDTEKAPSTLTEGSAEQLIFVIKDRGIGMTEEIITKYLLQVGRSYYTSPEFTSSYKFTPSSKFGIGFLSVFAVSRDVAIETRSALDDFGIRISLTGPRSYLLIEKSERRSVGTEIRVALGTKFTREQIVQYVLYRAKMAEFPISVVERGSGNLVPPFVGSSITPKLDGAAQLPDKLSVSIRCHEMSGPEVFGHIFHYEVSTSSGQELWASSISSGLRRDFPFNPFPVLPASHRCINGLTVNSPYTSSDKYSFQMDVRGGAAAKLPVLSRTETRRQGFLLRQHFIEPLAAHIASVNLPAEKSWIYKQHLFQTFGDMLGDWYMDVPDSIRVFESGRSRFISINELLELGSICVLAHRHDWSDQQDRWRVLLSPDPEKLVAVNVLGKEVASYDNWLAKQPKSSGTLIALPDWKTIYSRSWNARAVKIQFLGAWTIIKMQCASGNPIVHPAPLRSIPVTGGPEHALMVSQSATDGYGASYFVETHPIARAYNRLLIGDSDSKKTASVISSTFRDAFQSRYGGLASGVRQQLNSCLLAIRKCGLRIKDYKFVHHDDFLLAIPAGTSRPVADKAGIGAVSESDLE